MNAQIRVAVAGSLISWGVLPHLRAANHGAIGLLDPIHHHHILGANAALIEEARKPNDGEERQLTHPCARTA
jgi:hypothetical protein